MTVSYLNLAKVLEATSFGKSKIYQMIEAGTFPQNRTVHGKAVWLSTEIEEWLLQEWDKTPQKPQKKSA